jgi:hypothetical protein
LRSNNLAELSTGEIQSCTMIGHTDRSNFNQGGAIEIHLKSGSVLSQEYNSIKRDTSDVGYGYFTHEDPFPRNFATGSVCITRCDNSNPSLLLNLPKNDHLKDGIGQRGYVILPENIHPHIKHNLKYFLSKAGVNIGTNIVPVLDSIYEEIR